MAAWRSRLLRWYRASARDLPWRRPPASGDPYAIWLAEVMAQQTRIETMLPYWQRFRARFPDVRALAAAPEGEVLALWAGLGYYTRARALLRAAKLMAERHEGRVPATLEELSALPGIGPYTAGAIASIAHGVRAPVLDGNVMRVLARVLGIADPVDDPRVRQRLWGLADQLVWARDPGAWNQALMELGATVCLPPPKLAECARCPLRDDCVAHREGRVAELPARLPRRAARAVEWIALAVTRADEILLARRVPRGLFGGLWELPAIERSPPGASADALARQLGRALFGRAITPSRTAAAVVTHLLTHRRLTIRAHRAGLPAGAAAPAPPPGYDQVAWLSPAQLRRGEHALSSAAARMLSEIQAR